jgi:PKD repeat protein
MTVEFDASGSSDSDGSIIEYAWDFDGDGLYDGFSDGAVVSHTFTELGLFQVKLRVTDDQFARDTTHRLRLWWRCRVIELPARARP